MNPADYSATCFLICPICHFVMDEDTVMGTITNDTAPSPVPCAKPRCQQAWQAREAALDAAWLARHDEGR